ncbi:MAG TPA: plastocyanin/azurin family copper-binding protein [Flavisolibacter sp.]|nr:plastocyanin/azurin family copper-binding protein [Flavisolibacter sp.]
MKNQDRIFQRTAVFILFIMLAGCSSSPGEKTGEGEVIERAPQTHTVEISQMVFSPAEIAVKKGDRVNFINHDIVAHDVTEESTKAWTSSPLQSQQSWTLEVQESANYYCSLHPVMKGKIIVE